MDRRDSDRKDRPERLPYERPAVLSEEVFETLALSCAKDSPFTCPGGGGQPRS